MSQWEKYQFNAFYFGTDDRDPAPQSALQVPEAGRRATFGNGKKISLIFLVFSALCSLGSCALDDFLCIWRSVSEKERSQVSQKPTKFLETSEKTEGEWSLFVWELMRRIQGSKFTNLSTNELFSEIDYSKCQQRIQWTYQITNVARHLTCWVVCVWHFLPECHFVQLSNCTWNSFQSGKVYLIYCNSVLTIFISKGK